MDRSNLCKNSTCRFEAASLTTPGVVLVVQAVFLFALHVRATANPGSLDSVSETYELGEAFQLRSASYLGPAASDSDRPVGVVGSAVQSDGTIVLAANDEAGGSVLRVRPSGREVISTTSVGKQVHDLAIDGNDRIYAAAGGNGAVVLDASGNKTGRLTGQQTERIDVSQNGVAVTLGGKKVTVFGPNGNRLGTMQGKAYTEDVAVHGPSETVVITGFRNAHTSGNPVQICYLWGMSYDGERTWRNYDWSDDKGSDRWLNKPENNMADSRGYRCEIGADGKLYAAFEVAGGNHLFRYSPVDITEKSSIVGGDAHHEFYNSGAEHKTFFGRYEPDTGEYLRGQQFCGRLGDGSANAVRVKNGDITADKDGRVYLSGVSAYGLPLTVNPPGHDYTGGGFVLVMSKDFSERLLCTRLQGGGGDGRTVSVRTFDRRLLGVFGGTDVKLDEESGGLFTFHPLQKKKGSGFFAVFEAR